MITTSNYGYTVIEGTDSPVNIQNDVAPNFTAIDTDLKAVSDAAVTVATHTRAGTTHALVRDDADRALIRFIATADMITGDSFTVDGTPVTARLVNGEALQTGSFKINNCVEAVLVGTILNVNAINPIVNNAADVNYDNTASGLTASDVQDAIDELNSNIEAVNENVATYVSGIISAGNTSITLSNAAIKTTSFIDIYFWDQLLAPEDVNVTTGSVTIQIPAQTVSVNVAVRIANI